MLHCSSEGWLELDGELINEIGPSWSQISWEGTIRASNLGPHPTFGVDYVSGATLTPNSEFCVLYSKVNNQRRLFSIQERRKRYPQLCHGICWKFCWNFLGRNRIFFPYFYWYILFVVGFKKQKKRQIKRKQIFFFLPHLERKKKTTAQQIN